MLAILLAAATAVPPSPAVPDPGVRYERKLILTPGEMFKLAEVATIRGDLTTASAIYAALERNPDSDVRAEARFRYAKQLLGEKRNRDAALLLRRLIDEKPN